MLLSLEVSKIAYPRFQRARAFKYVAGTQAGDHSTASTTFTDINAAYQMALNAQVGDVLRLFFLGQFLFTTAASYLYLTWNVAGTGGDLTNWSSQVVSSTNPLQQICESIYTVAAGDITSGLVTVKPRWKVSANTVTLTNSGSIGPYFTAQNLGPVDPN